MKNYLSFTVLISLFFLFSSCSNDPVDIAEEYVELDKEKLELQLELIDLQKDQLKTYKKKKKKKKNPDYDGDEWEDKYIYEEVVDDWDEYKKLQAEIYEITVEMEKIRQEQDDLEMKAYNSCDDQDEYDEWMEDFEDEVESFEKDLDIEDLEEDVEKEWDRFYDKRAEYFDN